MFSLTLTLMFVTTLLGVAPAPQGHLPTHLDISSIRAIPVQHDGRWMPLDTLARDTVDTVMGERVFADKDPVLLLLAWTFEPAVWKDVPLITIQNRQLREAIKLSPGKTVYSYTELVNHEPLNHLISDLSHLQGERRLDPLESKVSDINKKLILLNQVFQCQVIRIIPDAKDILGIWQPILVLPQGIKGHTQSPAQTEWVALERTFLADDGPGFSIATDRLISALAALPTAYKPNPKLITAELRYNRCDFFRLAWMVMIAGALFSAVRIGLRKKWFDVFTIFVLIAGFGILTYGLSLRWQIAGHIPASNLFESLLFLSWGMGIFTILSMFVLSHRLVPVTASAMGAIALILADCLPIDHYIRPIAPVLLDTIWMSIHVPVIMVSYSVLALAVIIAHIQLIVMAIAPARKAFIKTIDSLHYNYVYVGSFLLLAGILTGSMWAASSWGRYWGWDPKEVWSLVALLGYLAILHVRIDKAKVSRKAYFVAALWAISLFIIVVPMLKPITGLTFLALAGTAAAMVIFLMARSQFATALKSILAFWLIIMTYVGVNFVLGTGLHSYAFGAGAVVHYLFLVGGIDLLLVGVCSGIYLFRFSGK
ncbi:MAG: cytochrome c biogenesis protein CcsA [Phycisphaerae bacterium]